MKFQNTVLKSFIFNWKKKIYLADWKDLVDLTDSNNICRTSEVTRRPSADSRSHKHLRGQSPEDEDAHSEINRRRS
ncbi:hypothetical protein M513_14094 [Trichuris suis]|uniref:Uncharacterized protein n=1 Tax=Trichuris suis TaxID=68888 RepID=A0A085LJ83_9BILA|nr:hypothetical protein M513_14094 [Trichuris suis]